MKKENLFEKLELNKRTLSNLEANSIVGGEETDDGGVPGGDTGDVTNPPPDTNGCVTDTCSMETCLPTICGCPGPTAECTLDCAAG